MHTKYKTVVTFETKGGSKTGDQHFTQWVNNAVGMIESIGNGQVVVRVDNHRYRLPKLCLG